MLDRCCGGRRWCCRAPLRPRYHEDGQQRTPASYWRGVETVAQARRGGLPGRHARRSIDVGLPGGGGRPDRRGRLLRRGLHGRAVEGLRSRSAGGSRMPAAPRRPCAADRSPAARRLRGRDRRPKCIAEHGHRRYRGGAASAAVGVRAAADSEAVEGHQPAEPDSGAGPRRPPEVLSGT